jgi:AAHS family 4-hydroxybenzoate transporter-like MFS transporter
MNPTAPIDIPALIDESPVGSFQVGILLLLGLTVILDGFDVQAIGYIAPAVLHDWGIDRAALGPVFGAGLVGMVIGSLIFSALADRVGRRPVLIGATLFFSLAMLATSKVTSLPQLTLLRAITGLGLGAIMPNAMALAGEYSPRRFRVTLMMLVSCGFTAGAVLGGVLSAVIIPQWGWRAVFLVGGVLPLVLAAAMAFGLPESMQFLVIRGRGRERVHGWLRQVAPAAVIGDDQTFVVHEGDEGRVPVRDLFVNGRAGFTLLLWGVTFIALVILYFLSNWLPTLAQGAGATLREAVWLGTFLQLGGMVGTVVMGPVIDRIGFLRVLVPAFIITAFAVALLGRPGIPTPLLFVVAGVAGFTVVGMLPVLNALAATVYPTTLRSTGIGWSLGIGRLGAIVGPVLAGALLALGWPQTRLFLLIGAPALLAALLLATMAGRLPGPRQPAAETQG